LTKRTNGVVPGQQPGTFVFKALILGGCTLLLLAALGSVPLLGLEVGLALALVALLGFGLAAAMACN